MRDRLSRRDFLGYSGATLAGITLGEWGRQRLGQADARAHAWQARGVERWATSVCRECPAACGIRVRLVDGAPVKIEGNPLCPIGRGRLCAQGQAAVESYFDPDRLVGPARRAGARGENRWQSLGWNEAIDLVASRLAEARGRILAVAAEEHGPLAAAWDRFWRALTARTAWTPSSTAARLRPPFQALTGAAGDPLFDLERASHVLSFGAPIVETWLSPVWSQRSYGRFRRSPGRPRGTLVQIDVRGSLTARKADEWIAVAPEQQVFLAYGIASVLLRENRVHHEFVDAVGGNLPEFAREVTARYSPDIVAEATGVPVVTVLRLARDLVASTSPLVVVGADAATALADAVFALNALVGAYDRPGGVFLSPAPPTPEGPDVRAAFEDPAWTAGTPRVVAFRDASALRSLGSPVDRAALATADLVVSFSPYLDETAAVADLLLPTHTPLESWHARIPAPVLPLEALSIAAPAVLPRLDTRDLAALLATIAAKMGSGVATVCAWRSSDDLVKAEIDRQWEARRGGPFSDAYETEWLLQLERGGWWTPAAESSQEFAGQVLERGGWADPYFVPGRLTQILRARGGLTFSTPLVIPRIVAPSRAYPLRLIAFTPNGMDGPANPNRPSAYELLGQPDATPWSGWAELNPETAKAFGIHHGSTMKIASASGSIDVQAVHVEGMPADVVALAFVPAVPGGGRWARLMGADARGMLGGAGPPGFCAVRVTRA